MSIALAILVGLAVLLGLAYGIASLLQHRRSRLEPASEDRSPVFHDRSGTASN